MTDDSIFCRMDGVLCRKFAGKETVTIIIIQFLIC